MRVGDLVLPEGVETDVDVEEPVVIGSAPAAVEVAEGEAVEGEAAEGAAEGESGGGDDASDSGSSEGGED